MPIAFLVLAIVLMSFAHFLRVLRWELFVKVYEKPDKKRLLASLSLGYILNYFLPYKLGDLFRGFYAGYKMKSGKSLGLSTVIVDRYLDIFTVGLIFLVLSLTNRENESLVHDSRFYIILFGALLVGTLLVYLTRGLLKKLIRLIASLFNSRLEVSVLTFAWALIWNFKDIFQKINKIKLILYTVLMWGVYILSYWAFSFSYSSVGENMGWIDIFSMLFGESGVKASTIMISLFNDGFNEKKFYLIIYMIAPLLILILLSFIVRQIGESRLKDEEYLNLLPQLNAEERLIFLDKYFSNESKEYIDNYLKINHSISIVRDYSAGSNATTMLCVDDTGMFFRKYAFGKASVKLREQIEWMTDNASLLPVASVIKSEMNDMYCYYDMPYYPSAIGMFEFVHSMPTEESIKLMECILTRLENTIYKKNCSSANVESIKQYIDKKVTANLKAIKEHKKFRQLMEYDELVINGTAYKNLSFYEQWLSENNLITVFENDEYALIHGDLTIENIVCNRSAGGFDFYLIDPNTGNIHESPFLDYAKILQSLHGGYEFLMSVKNVSMDGNNINFIYTKSDAYSKLMEWMDEYLDVHYSKEQVKSIYMHEIVHWLRLLPYKLDKDARTAPVFLAGMLLVLDDVYKRFEEV